LRPFPALRLHHGVGFVPQFGHHQHVEQRHVLEIAAAILGEEVAQDRTTNPAEFVDWSGVAFFYREKDKPVLYPKNCDCVFAVIDTALKTGTENDATAVTFFAYTSLGPLPLLILDWDITQIEGSLLEMWLPTVFQRLEELARICSAPGGSIGAMIEDKNSGTILIQQAQRRGLQAQAIDSKFRPWARTNGQ
jgi:hypothetical protein